MGFEFFDLNSKILHLKPRGFNFFDRKFIVPASIGVMLGNLISSFANVTSLYIGQSTKIVDRKTGEITYGKIPPYSVIVPGSLPDKKNPNAPSLNCAVIIKQVDEKTRSKTSINDLLRD